MAGKTDKQFFFEVQLNWLAETRGVLSARDATGLINVATPPEFGGEGKPWSPEHLFISSISGCFMSTYLAFAKKLYFDIAGFECNTIGQIEIINGRYKFSNINLYPKIYITDETLRAKAKLVLEKTHQYCLISNSVNAIITYNTEILISRNSKHEMTKDVPALKTILSPLKVETIGMRPEMNFEI